ncbi:MAG: hypothetical protein JW952_01520, partial [Candidatus Eisenbacteria bacterium]|nr:hypothetical protein [Candidatus Eisenbacteria bacterium]
RLYTEGRGLPCYVAVHQDATGTALRAALAYAGGLGCAGSGLLETTFRDEAEVDLFGEQAVLCGGISFLLLKAFNVLVENGYEPEMAYMECVSQLKASADVIHEAGLDGFAERVSTPALYGLLTRGNRVIGDDTERAMRGLLRDIRSGEFVKEWLRESKAAGAVGAGTRLSRLLAAWNALRIHGVGRGVRGLSGREPRLEGAGAGPEGESAGRKRRVPRPIGRKGHGLGREVRGTKPGGRMPQGKGGRR